MVVGAGLIVPKFPLTALVLEEPDASVFRINGLGVVLERGQIDAAVGSAGASREVKLFRSSYKQGNRRFHVKGHRP